MRSGARRGIWVAGAAALMLLAACGGGGAAETPAATGSSWDTVLSAAKDEGQVTFYCAPSQQACQEIADAFERDNPDIAVQLFRALPAELYTKIDTEFRTGAAGGDVVYGPEKAWFADKSKAGYFVPMTGSAMSEPAFDAARWAPTGDYALSSSYPTGFAWNTSLFSGKITNWSDLLDPSLRGKNIGIPDAADAKTIAQYYQYVEEVAGPEYLTQLAAQQPLIIGGAAAGVRQALLAGEVRALPYSSTSILDEIEKGAPAEFGLPVPAYGVTQFVAPLRNAKNPNAAQVFANWMIATEGQTMLGKRQAVVRTDVTALVNASQLRLDSDMTPLTDEAYQQYVQAWNAKFGR